MASTSPSRAKPSRRPRAETALRPTTAMVLAAGHGTRLRPLTLERPKPLLEVLGRPLASYALDHAIRIGATRAILNTHHLGAQIRKHLQGRYRESTGKSIALAYSNEPTLLGTGGGLRKMWTKELTIAPVAGPVLILNADALIDLDTDSLSRTFASPPTAKEGRQPLSTMVLQQAPDAKRYGMIGTNPKGRVVHFAGRADAPDGGGIARERMFCGVHLVDPALFDMVPAPPYGEGGVCINQVGYPPAIASGELVRSLDHKGIFWDVGTPERLLEANLRLLGGHDRLRHSDPFAGLMQAPVSSSYTRATRRDGPPRLGRPRSNRVLVGKGVRIDPGANITGPVLIGDGAVIGRGAQVGPYVVIGPNARVGVEANLSYSVVNSGARVIPGRNVRGVILGKSTQAPVADAAIAASLGRTAKGQAR